MIRVLVAALFWLALSGGADGTRTRDPRRDRPIVCVVFLGT